MIRTRLLAVSLKITSPALSKTGVSGWKSSAAVAGPPSPLNPWVPVPAIV